MAAFMASPLKDSIIFLNPDKGSSIHLYELKTRPLERDSSREDTYIRRVNPRVDSFLPVSYNSSVGGGRGA